VIFCVGKSVGLACAVKLVRRVILIERRSAVPTDVVIVSHRRDDERQRLVTGFAGQTSWFGGGGDTYRRDSLTAEWSHDCESENGNRPAVRRLSCF